LKKERDQKLESEVDAAKKSIEDKFKSDTDKASLDAKTLTTSEKEAVESKANGHIAGALASYNSGKTDIDVPTAEEAVKKEEADAVQASKIGLTDAQKANLEGRVTEMVAEKLPALLQEEVAAKFENTKSESIVSIEKDIKEKSDSQLKVDIEKETSGHNATSTETIKAKLEEAASVQMAKDINVATTGASLADLEVNVRQHLSETLKPDLEKSLTAQMMKDELAKAERELSQSTGSDAVDGAKIGGDSNGGEANGGAQKELGSTALDGASDFKNVQQSNIKDVSMLTDLE